MRQVCLLGNPDSRRAVYLKRAMVQTGTALCVLDWKDWEKAAGLWSRAGEGRKTEWFVKIDPPSWDSYRLRELDRLTAEYRQRLAELSRLARKENNCVTFWNPPEAIEMLLDKEACKRRLTAAGLPVTEAVPLLLPLSVSDGEQEKEPVEVLLEQMKGRNICQIFLKPVRGSGAAGVSAFRIQSGTGRMALYTCAALHPEYGLVNTRRLQRYSDPEQISGLLREILRLGCMAERWYAKAEHQGFSYDLRAVVQEGRVEYILARLSRGPVTNLHLNNHPLETEALGLAPEVMTSVRELCLQAMACFPALKSAGIDILLEKGSLRPRIIEMNAQGDLIYQDIFRENRIYLRQAERMKQWTEQTL